MSELNATDSVRFRSIAITCSVLMINLNELSANDDSCIAPL